MATDTEGHRPRSRTDAQSERAREPMPARTVPLHLELDGWLRSLPAKVTATVLPDQVEDLLRGLRAAGFRPRLAFDRTAEGHPLCPRHGVVMSRREKQGDEWFSHKVVDAQGREHYCRGYRGPESPGYEVRMERQG